MSFNPKRALAQISDKLKFKNDKVYPPDFYLGAKLTEKELNGKKVWTMSAKEYIKASIENVEKRIKAYHIFRSNNAEDGPKHVYRGELG